MNRKKDREFKKEYLESYRELLNKSNRLDITLVEYKNAIDYSETVNEKLGLKEEILQQQVDKIKEEAERISAELKETNDRLKEILDAINQISSEFKKLILVKRYIAGIDIEDIAADMHYSKRQIYRLRDTALDELVINDGTQCQN